MTPTDALATIGQHLSAVLQAEPAPSFKSAQMTALLEAIGRVSSPDDPRNAARLGLLVAGLLTQQLKASMTAERDAALALQHQRLQ